MNVYIIDTGDDRCVTSMEPEADLSGRPGWVWKNLEYFEPDANGFLKDVLPGESHPVFGQQRPRAARKSSDPALAKLVAERHKLERRLNRLADLILDRATEVFGKGDRVRVTP